MTSPFEGLEEHAKMVKECAMTFQRAIESHVSGRNGEFEKLRDTIVNLESRADAVKRRIRGHIPKGTLMPVDKFEIFRYLKEQDSVLDAVEDALDWISYRSDPGIPDSMHKDFLLFVEAVIDPIDKLSDMVREARVYFQKFSEERRFEVKTIIRDLRRLEHIADTHEDGIKKKALNSGIDPVTVFHMVRLAETIGSIADHAENAGDMMRAMVAK